MNHEVLFQAGIILFPVELLGEMGDPLSVISTRDSLILRMRFQPVLFLSSNNGCLEAHIPKYYW